MQINNLNHFGKFLDDFGLLILLRCYHLISIKHLTTIETRITMALTDFGKAVRKARIDTGFTLLTMSQALSTTPAFLSGLETGRKKIPSKWVELITDLFAKHGYHIDNLQELANISNETVPLNGLTLQQQMLVAGFAKSQFTPEQLKQFSDLLDEISKK